MYAKNDDYEVMFEGEFREGERVQGKYVKNQFDWIYTGPFLKNVPHGEGVMQLKKGKEFKA